jgi:hypothetical protein
VSGATVIIRMKAGSGSHTDHLHFMEDGVSVWSRLVSDLQGWQTGGADASWDEGDVNTFTFDLANLPFPRYGVTNILATLQDGDLDVFVQDDTGVDYVKLILESCVPVVTEVEDVQSHVALSMPQNHPNPFNPRTTIQFDLPMSSHVNVSIYDLKGRHITTLIDEFLPAGHQSISWAGKNSQGAEVAAGVYFYRLQCGKRNLTGKMLLLK